MQSVKRALIVMILLVAGATAGFFIHTLMPAGEPDNPGVDVAQNPLEGENKSLRDKIAALEGRIDDLLLQLKAAKNIAKSPGDGKAAIQPAVAKGLGQKGKGLFRLKSVDEADGIFEQSVESLDVDALCRLGATLLAMGEPGYDKLLDLLEDFMDRVRGDKVFQEWLDSETLLAGDFVRHLMDHHENLIRFGLYSTQLDPDTLPEPMRHLINDIDDVGAIFAGIYDGSEPDINKGMMDLFEGQLEAELKEERSHKVRDYIRAIAQLKDQRARDYLVGLVDFVHPNDLDDLVKAIAFQGNTAAIPVLNSLKENISDPKMKGIIDIALIRLQSGKK